MRTRDYSLNRAILAALEERRGYVSGEDLSGRFGLSRAAIWKHIQALRDDGYEIKAKPHQGYVLVQRPDRLSSYEIRRNLRTAGLIGDICTFEEVTSTNDKAYELALHGAQEGVVVIAESQTEGRGRLNRAWFSPHGKNLYLSVILRPSIPPKLAPVLTYLGAISTAEVLSDTFSLDVELKWPNDVLRRGKKIAGLLNEVKAETDRVEFVVLGFGVNLNLDTETLPREIREKATSLMAELGHKVSRVEFTGLLLESIETWYNAFLLQGAIPVVQKWESLARVRGAFLEVKSFGELYQGVVEGLDHDGALLLRKDNGEQMRVIAGDVTKASVQPPGIRGKRPDE